MRSTSTRSRTRTSSKASPKELHEYRQKRDFGRTPEPRGNGAPKRGRTFVVQKHAARRLHYDFRLELDGTLKSWAVPKGPSLDPAVKSLAVAVEDHPLEYADFEGIIPQGEYGGGTVMVWDYGVYAPENVKKVSDGLKKGDLKFVLLGKKLKGSFVLVRTGDRQWLLIKHKDEYVEEGADITEAQPYSILTKRTLAEIAEDEGGVVKKAATADPQKLPPRRGIKRRKKAARKKVWHSNRY